MKLPALSVIVPNYNHGQYLPACLRAILEQSVPPAEVIIIDDASTDNSMEVLNEFSRHYPHLRIYRNERNQGVVCGLNRGMELAQGDYVFFASADDEIKLGLFERSLPLLAEHPEAALSCTISEWHDVASGLSWHMAAGMADRSRYLSPDDLVRLGRRGKLIICTSSAIMKKEPLRQVGGFLAELRWHCDWFATAVPAFRHGLCFIPEPLSDFYLHPNSYYNRGRKGPEHRQVLRNIIHRLASPACADVAPRIRKSSLLGVFGLPIIALLLRDSGCRQFLTPHLTFRACSRSGELFGKKILPAPLARLCLRLLYHHRPAVEARG